MNSAKAAKNAAKGAAQILREPLETLKSQVAKPLAEEMGSELGSFFGAPKSLGTRPKALAQEDLQRARQQQEIDQKNEESEKESKAKVYEIVATIKQEYKTLGTKKNQEEHQMKEQFSELQEEVAKLAKTAGVETTAHMQNSDSKIGTIDIKFLTGIVRFLRIKAEESKSAKDLQAQRQNAKRTTGMLAWVSGKQMKVHEQGTLTLQG